jgi:hypothetical protein
MRTERRQRRELCTFSISKFRVQDKAYCGLQNYRSVGGWKIHNERVLEAAVETKNCDKRGLVEFKPG